MKTYKADYEDGEFEIFTATNSTHAYITACEYEDEHGELFNVFEIDDDYNEIRTVF